MKGVAPWRFYAVTAACGLFFDRSSTVLLPFYLPLRQKKSSASQHLAIFLGFVFCFRMRLRALLLLAKQDGPGMLRLAWACRSVEPACDSLNVHALSGQFLRDAEQRILSQPPRHPIASLYNRGEIRAASRRSRDMISPSGFLPDRVFLRKLKNYYAGCFFPVSQSF